MAGLHACCKLTGGLNATDTPPPVRDHGESVILTEDTLYCYGDYYLGLDSEAFSERESSVGGHIIIAELVDAHVNIEGR